MYILGTMHIPYIITIDNPILKSISEPISSFNSALHQLITYMKRALFGSRNGVAIAAPQIGILERVIVIHYENEYLEMINPEYLHKSIEKSLGYEGCLSVPNKRINVERHHAVTVSYFDRNGIQHTITRNGNMARCIQHEIDHLDGITIAG